ncbi:MAG: radical SAM protein [Planctomycetota bacterium]|nr:radical SAM protein [Planctomycetota bacterium]
MSDTKQSGHQEYLPRLIAWEVTRSCPLACKHCRAAAHLEPYPGELSTDECRRVLENIAAFAKPTMILTGGEPMLRTDIYDIAEHAHRLGLPVVMAPCGKFVDDAAVARMKRAGIHAISISIDGASAASHDAFRGIQGAFAFALQAAEAARRGGLDFQINTTITQHNLAELPEILALAVRLGAIVFNPFLLVPTGRGKELVGQEISPEDYERTLHWLAGQEDRTDIRLRVTCAPHYTRVLHQRKIRDSHLFLAGEKGSGEKGSDPLSVQGSDPFSPACAGPACAPGDAAVVVPPHTHPGQPPARGKGCLGGKAFAFISHVGKVQICGFLETECGDLRRENFDFRKIWQSSPVFLAMRDVDRYHGKCGRCEYRRICGGCRARAYAMTDDALAEEPFCIYQPR